MGDSTAPAEQDEFEFDSTEEIDVPDRLIDQVIGQDQAVEIIRLAAHQRRFVMLMGEPGTGKSMLGAALSELLPSGDLKDVLAYPNPEEPNLPIIKQVPAGEGKQRVEDAKQDARQRENAMEFLFWAAMVAVGIVTLYLTWTAGTGGGFDWYYYLLGGVIAAGVLF
ncbi:MAG: ATP-binding protein, partial [bacterium]